MFSFPRVAGHQDTQSGDLREKIGIDKIRIRKIGTHSTTILRSVARADVLLQDWHKSAMGCGECEFEIVFIDGYLLKGKLDFNRKPLCRPSLRRYLQTIGKSIVPGAPDSTQAISEEQGFLDIYEVDV